MSSDDRRPHGERSRGRWLRCSPRPARFRLPIYKEIVLAHGSGGKLSHQLIEKMVLPQFRNELLAPLHDGAVFSIRRPARRFQHRFLRGESDFFPGGDIGKLAVHGTVNDLAMCGARPLYLSRRRSSSKKARRWRISGASCNRCARPRCCRGAVGHRRYQSGGSRQRRQNFH